MVAEFCIQANLQHDLMQIEEKKWLPKDVLNFKSWLSSSCQCVIINPNFKILLSDWAISKNRLVFTS